MERRRQFMDDRVDAVGRWGMYGLALFAVAVIAAIVLQFVSGSDPRNNSWFVIFFALFAGAGSICAIVCAGNGLLALWAWSMITLRSVLTNEQSPFQSFWRRPYGPRVAIIALIIVASVPAVYFRFHNPPLFFGILVLVALISRGIVARF